MIGPHRAVVSLAAALILMVPVPSANEAAGPHGGWDLIIDDYFVVDYGEEETFSNVSILLRSWIYIYGVLRLVNTTLEMEGDSGIGIHGRLEVTDYDGDSSTGNDSSSVRGSGGIRPVMKWDGGGARLILRNSRMERLTLLELVNELTGSELIDVEVRSPAGGSVYRSTRFYGSLNRTAVNITGIPVQRMDHCLFEGFGTGIRASSCELDMTGCELRGLKEGLISTGGRDMRIRECVFTNVTDAISAEGSTYIFDSTFEGGEIRVGGRSSNIKGNTFNGTETVAGLESGWVTDNVFYGSAIGIDRPANITITRNLFTDCGVAVREDVGCIVYHNIFGKNTHDVLGAPYLGWYNATLREGNYYDRYTGVDDGYGGRRPQDGKGDTDLPYLQRDMYPLMSELYTLQPEIPDPYIRYTRGSDTVTITWWGDDGDHYLVERSPAPTFDSSLGIWSTSSKTIDIMDNPNSTLFFRVGAYNSYGSRGWCEGRSIKVDRIPLPPLDLRVESLPEGEALNVSWRTIGEDISGVYVHWGTDDYWGMRNRSVRQPRNWLILHGELDGIENGRTYSIFLRSEDGSGQLSGSSGTLTAVPVDTVPPPPPRSFRAEVISNTTVSLSWIAPQYQDLIGYIIYRRVIDRYGEPLNPFRAVHEVGSSTNYLDDGGLFDNTTYEYGIRAVDDDGPLSEMAGPIRVRTLHFNNPPIFIPEELMVRLVEDGDPGSIDLNDVFIDPDGDPVSVRISESYPFPAEILGGILYIRPEPNQAGNGYVHLKVSDTEEAQYFLIGVVVEEIPDPIHHVRITSPANGSVLSPGKVIVLEADIFDPDETDRLVIEWYSNLDGQLDIRTGSNTGGERVYRHLSNGVHSIVVEVSDSQGNHMKDEVSVIVSLWGWGEIPWMLEPAISGYRVAPEGGYINVRVINGADIQLTFTCSGTVDTGLELEERIIVLGQEEEGHITLRIPGGLRSDMYELVLHVRSETVNGTFAGERSLSTVMMVVDEEGEGGMEGLLEVLGAIGVLFVFIAAIAAVLILRNRRRGGEENGVK